MSGRSSRRPAEHTGAALSRCAFVSEASTSLNFDCFRKYRNFPPKFPGKIERWIIGTRRELKALGPGNAVNLDHKGSAPSRLCIQLYVHWSCLFRMGLEHRRRQT